MDSNNLVNFLNNVSSDIRVALHNTTPKRKRHITPKKFAENRVKRLDNNRKPIRPSTATGALTKSKSAQLKPSASARPASHLVHAYTWPEIVTSHTATMQPIQTTGMSTCAFPTTLSSLYSNSESDLCLTSMSSSQSSRPIDPELESLLSEFESPSVPISRRGSFESVCTGTSSCTPPLNTLEAQVYIADQAYSPYSDYSDELDSAYSSPVESARVSYNCSPTNLGTSMPDWHSGDLLPPMSSASTCLQEPEMGMMTSRCDWVSHDSRLAVSSVPSIYDQGPPMTPTVSQLLEQYNQY